ncbi:hypothetical protein DA2_2381 [Desulfovibrio sp. A2]|nr:hypothetical protein DA2_2381 [Desulfovibrio sp. A2]
MLRCGAWAAGEGQGSAACLAAASRSAGRDARPRRKGGTTRHAGCCLHHTMV